MNFERIDRYRARAKVHGGWIVETIIKYNKHKKPSAIAMCYISDPNYEWQLENIKDDPKGDSK